MKPSPGRLQPPRILLVEDDPVSSAFLTAALTALPAQVDAADCCAGARQWDMEAPGHDLWLIDANLPDGTGAALLAELRVDTPSTPALAHTASRQREELDALIAAGFSEVLVKPLSAQVLQGAVCRALGLDMPLITPAADPAGKLPNWDEAAALLALKGEQAHVATLRRLFLDELPAQRQAVATALADGDIAQAGQILHRLRASCGFVGAARLGSAVQALEREPSSAQAMQRFDDAAADLLPPA